MNKEDLLNLNDNKNKSPKKLLIYGAIAFLVFVIGVIVFALVSGGNSNKENTEVIPPQVKEEPLFKEIPIENENKENNISTTAKAENTNTMENKQNNTKNQNLPVAKNNIQTQTPPKTQVQQSQIQTKPAPKITAKKNNIKKSEIKQKPLKYNSKKHSKTITQKYYIQVAAFLKYKHPNKKFLELIKKYGYKYTIYPVSVNKNGKKIKVNKLLIGPFASRNEAKKELIKVKKYITQNAFIFKAK